MRRRPLLLVGGAAGAGKSSVRSALIGTIDEVVAFESDVLWSDRFETRHEEFRRLWLRIARDANESGRPVAIFGAGFAVPHNVEPLPERASFSAVHYLALVCDDQVLASRIRARVAPRCTSDEHVAEHVSYNQWLRANAMTSSPPITTIDTTRIALDETAERVRRWISERLG